MTEKTMDDVWMELKEQFPIDEIVKFSEFNISEKLMENTWQLTKFTELYQKEAEELNRIMALKDKIIGMRYDFYRFNYDKELRQSEIEKYYLPKDEKIIKINKIIRQQQWRVEFFSMCVKAIDKVQWNMKNFNDNIKMGR